MGGTGQDQGWSVAVDAAGNVFTTGSFSGTVDFDPGTGTSFLTSAGGLDIFVSKLTNAGNFVWAKQLGGLDNFVVGQGIALDGSGNVYSCGYFQGVADFDPGIGIYNLTSNNSGSSQGVFISKLDASGNFTWAKQFYGTGNDFGYGIAIDVTGNVFTTGAFNGTADFDPGPGTVFLAPASGGKDIFVSKLDASGNFVWAKQFGGPGAADDYGHAIIVDGSGNVYTTGRFLETVDFDPGPGIYNLTTVTFASNCFISKLDAGGNFVFAKQIGGSSTGFSIAVNGSL